MSHRWKIDKFEDRQESKIAFLLEQLSNKSRCQKEYFVESLRF